MKCIWKILLKCTVSGKLAAAAMHGACSMADYLCEMFFVRLKVSSSAPP